ncbi:MAG: hypothetical protein ACYSVY_00105 [Planctomycetota bacterium]|jgi:hypothetical protein
MVDQAKTYVQEMKVYIMGHLGEEEKRALAQVLEQCLTPYGETDYVAQRAILRKWSRELWDWKQSIS